MNIGIVIAVPLIVSVCCPSDANAQVTCIPGQPAQVKGSAARWEEAPRLQARATPPSTDGTQARLAVASAAATTADAMGHSKGATVAGRVTGGIAVYSGAKDVVSAAKEGGPVLDKSADLANSTVSTVGTVTHLTPGVAAAASIAADVAKAVNAINDVRSAAPGSPNQTQRAMDAVEHASSAVGKAAAATAGAISGGLKGSDGAVAGFESASGLGKAGGAYLIDSYWKEKDSQLAQEVEYQVWLRNRAMLQSKGFVQPRRGETQLPVELKK